MSGEPDWFGAHASDDFCYLTTSGRRTGKPHTIEIWFVVEGAAVYMLAEGGERADWVRNIRQNSAVLLRLGEQTRPAIGRIVDDRVEADPIRQLLVAKYQEWRPDQPVPEWAVQAVVVAVALPG